MKKYINKKYKNSNCRFLLFGLFVIFCTAAHCQEENHTIQFSMAYYASEEEIDSLKWNIITYGDESSWFKCELAMFYTYNGSASVMYKEFFPCTLIMAYVYDFIPAYHFIFTILKEYHKERGDEWTKEELQLCIRSLNILISKGITMNEQELEELENLKLMLGQLEE